MLKKISINKIISLCTLMVIFSATIFTFRQYETYNNSEKEYKEIRNALETEMNIIIKTVLSENKHKAELYIGEHSNVIHQKILNAYGSDLNKLEQDIINPTVNSKLTKILDSVLEGVFINEDNDLNTPFVTSMSLILWNKTLQFASGDNTLMSLEDFKNSQFNVYLAQEAVEAIKNMNIDKNEFIFWEPIDTGLNNHKIITDMNINKLLEVFYNEGMTALRSYELLIPIYITKDGDVFGTKDITSLGHKIDNYKIIIIQRINVYDSLKPYLSDIEYCLNEISKYENKVNKTNSEVISLVVETLIFILFILIASAILQNKLLKNK